MKAAVDMLGQAPSPIVRRLSSPNSPFLMQTDGFDGADKVFLFEFSMPMDDASGFNADMPAIVRILSDLVSTSPNMKRSR